MYGQYDSSDGSMDAMGLNVDTREWRGRDYRIR